MEQLQSELNPSNLEGVHRQTLYTSSRASPCVSLLTTYRLQTILGARGSTDIEAREATIAHHLMEIDRPGPQIRQPRAELNSTRDTLVKLEDQIAVMQDTQNTVYPREGAKFLSKIGADPDASGKLFAHA